MNEPESIIQVSHKLRPNSPRDEQTYSLHFSFTTKLAKETFGEMSFPMKQICSHFLKECNVYQSGSIQLEEWLASVVSKRWSAKLNTNITQPFREYQSSDFGPHYLHSHFFFVVGYVLDFFHSIATLMGSRVWWSWVFSKSLVKWTFEEKLKGFGQICRKSGMLRDTFGSRCGKLWVDTSGIHTFGWLQAGNIHAGLADEQQKKTSV